MNETGVSPLTIALLKRFEGYTATPKWDEKQYSVGYSTRWNPGEPVGTMADHEAALGREAGQVNSWLNKNVSVPMTEEQRAALNSFGYNTGTGSLDRLKDDINSGDWNKVGQRMLSFSRAGDDPEALLPRRQQEVAMLGGQAPANLDVNDAAGSLAPMQTAATAPSEKATKMGLFSMLGGQLGSGFGGGSGNGVPSLASGADPDAMQNLFGTLGSFGGGQTGTMGGQDNAGLKLASDAATAADSPEGGLAKMAPKPFDMQKLAAMLKNSGYLGTAQPRRPA